MAVIEARPEVDGLHGSFEIVIGKRLLVGGAGVTCLIMLVTACSATSAREVSTIETVIPLTTPTSVVPEPTAPVIDPPTTQITEPPAPIETLPPPEVSVLDRPLVAVGEAGGIETARIQLRLIELGFWVSHFDGKYGLTTRQGVMAFQKYVGLEPTGRMDEQTALALTIVSSRPLGRTIDPGVVVEIDKDRQLLFLVIDGRVEWVLNTSSGSGQYYLERNQKDPTKWEAGRSLTPSGRFVVNRERPDGWWNGDLGEIYRPKYFNGGIAIHGSRSIPNYPASHGCVRVSTAAMDMIWSTGLVPKNTAIWVYGSDVPARGEPPVIPPPVIETPENTIPNFTIPSFNFSL